MKLRLMSIYFAVAVLAAPILALAREDEDTVKLEGRLEGFPGAVRLEKTSIALTWLFFLFLLACAVAALLKNARRTHLD